jgi:hypothetical protein
MGKVLFGVHINDKHELDIDLIRKSEPTGYLPDDDEDADSIDLNLTPEKVKKLHEVTWKLLGGIPEEFLIKK